MKRLLVCLLTLCLLISCAACGTAAPSAQPGGSQADTAQPAETQPAVAQEPVELTFWAHQEGSWNESFQRIAEQFTKENPNIKIKFEFFPYDEYQSKMQTSLIAKSGGADIYDLWGGWAIDFAPTGALAEIPEDMAASIRSDSYPSTIGSLEYNGKLYGMPMEFNIEFGGMFVNLNLLQKNNLTMPATWDDLISEAKKATVKQGDEFLVKGFDFVNYDSVTYLFTSMIINNGGQYLNKDGTVNFTSPQSKEAFTRLTDLVTKDQVTDLVGLTGGGTLEGYQLLFSDKALFVPRGPWPIAEGRDTFELTYDKDFTYAALPWFGDVKAFTAETGWALSINANSKYKDEALKFFQYFYSDNVLMRVNTDCSMIPPKKSVANNPELLKSMPFAAPLVKILDKVQYIGYFNTDVFKESINNAFVDYCSGKYASADDALSALEKDLNGKLKK